MPKQADKIGEFVAVRLQGVMLKEVQTAFEVWKKTNGHIYSHQISDFIREALVQKVEKYKREEKTLWKDLAEKKEAPKKANGEGKK